MDNKKWNIGLLNKDKHLSEKTKQKISIKIKEGFENGRGIWSEGKPLPNYIKDKISIAKKGTKSWNAGIPRTKEEKLKISNSMKGNRAWNKGNKWSVEEKRKMSEGAKKMWKRRKDKIYG